MAIHRVNDHIETAIMIEINHSHGATTATIAQSPIGASEFLTGVINKQHVGFGDLVFW